MAQQAFNRSDERLNELSDRDALWGPLLAFRPQKNLCISNLRALALAATFGGFYGVLLSMALTFICRIARQHAPSPYAVPLLLTSICFVGFQFTLGPAWNRRARLLVRRADYLQSIGRPNDQLP
jgi:hypothetical protein